MLEEANRLEEAKRALTRYASLADAELRPLEGGLINHTFLVTKGGERWILQRVHPVFGPEVHYDIEAVTRHLEGKGMRTPVLLRTLADTLWVSDVGERPWRLMTFVDGVSLPKLTGVAMAREAGALVARFHSALADLEYDFRFSRPGAHDTPKHMDKLRRALDSHRHVPEYDGIASVGRAILAEAANGLDFATLPKMVAHGDLKISNLLFDAQGVGQALVDLDTCAHLPLAVELGDALRSWCNPAAEDTSATHFDLDLFTAAMTGYVAGIGNTVSSTALATVVAGVWSISLELASRFCADALLDEYFGWDSRRFASRRAHNLVRAEGQLCLYRSVFEQRAEALRRLESL